MKRVKIEEKLLWTAYRKSPTLFRTVPSPTPYDIPFLEIGGLQLSYLSYLGLQIWRVGLHLQRQSEYKKAVLSQR